MSSESKESPRQSSKDSNKAPSGDTRKFISRATDELAAMTASLRQLRAETGESAYEIRSRLNSIEHRLAALEREFGMTPPTRPPKPTEPKPNADKRAAKSKSP